ncbi:MAG TPA: LLM class flavin-dependent oxidoreductase [Xanthobacteraceae bacterium]|nr:LLM class flavin-dependent oxidoreductase [Xanthobacteraceae bacterium]
MADPKRQIKLGAFLYPTGHHLAAWRHPSSAADAGMNFAHYVEMAQLAERGLFDMLFVADNLTVWEGDESAIRHFAYVAWFEPITLMAALAPMTRHIGLVCTSTTTYDEPFHVARRFASLDLISGGRAGWNLVTSAKAAEAKNFGRDEHLAKDERYLRAREFAEVVTGLWDSFEPDAFVRDRASGIFFDSRKMHPLNHRGAHFRVRGPLNVGPSPQGRPVLVQAGSSDDGRALAAETADVIFTAQRDIASARAFYADVKDRVRAHGRDPDEVKIMPGVFVTVGRSNAEARDKFEALQNLIHPQAGLFLLSNFLAMNLSDCDVDGPVPELPPSRTRSSRAQLLVEVARRDNLTIRQLYTRIAGARGHQQLYGTAVEIADRLEEWFTGGAADGFNIMPPVLPESLQDFVTSVIPELQRRGLFRTAYEGRTLRENLGLKWPANRHAAGAAAGRPPAAAE